MRYVQDDNLGFILALFSLSPVFIMVMYVTIIVFKRDLHSIFATVGQVFGVIVCIALKKILSQPRPEDSDLDDEGMPSNHAQFLFFFFVYHSNAFFQTKILNTSYKIIYSCILFIFATIVSYSRLYLHYHTADQVVVGAIVGALIGLSWYQFSRFVLPFIESSICSLSWMKWLCVRDYSEVDYSPCEEYLALQVYKKHKK